MELGALTVIMTLKHDSFSRSEFSNLLLDVYNLSSFFSDTSVNHVFMNLIQQNMLLLKFALELDNELSWWEELPLLTKLKKE